MLALDAGAERFDLAAFAEAVQHDVGALAGQHLCDAEADAAGRSGDDRNLVLQHDCLPL